MAYSPGLAESWGLDDRGGPAGNPSHPSTVRNRILASGPQDFQAVFDLLDAFDLAHRFLGHLLLKVRPHRALEDDAAALGFEPQRAAVDIGIGLNGLIDSVG